MSGAVRPCWMRWVGYPPHGNVHKDAHEEDRPEQTLFVITTDGMENASRRYDYRDVKAMIERQKEKHGWEFLFLGANIDATKEASRFGIRPETLPTTTPTGRALPSSTKQSARPFAPSVHRSHWAMTGGSASMKTITIGNSRTSILQPAENVV